MKMLDRHPAMDCETTPHDWSVLGAGIVRAATMAAAVHLAEQARRAVLQAGSDAVGASVAPGVERCLRLTCEE